MKKSKQLSATGDISVQSVTSNNSTIHPTTADTINNDTNKDLNIFLDEGDKQEDYENKPSGEIYDQKIIDSNRTPVPPPVP